jgi:hypothetical protein
LVPLAAGITEILSSSDSRGAIEVQSPGRRKELGEPYQLAGKKLMFTNWHYIRPGEFGWYDQAGKNVTVVGSVPLTEARMRHRDLPYGIRLVAQAAERVGPLVQPETPWEEGAGVAFTTIIKDSGMYRAWLAPFTTSGNPKGQNHFCYFESTDGFAWKRPKLGVVDYEGSRDNNIVNVFQTDGGTVFVDPAAPAGERYKLIAEGPFPKEAVDKYVKRRPSDWDPRSKRQADGSVIALKGGFSGDGIHWTVFPQPLCVQVSDTHIVGYYDEKLHTCVVYTRTWTVSERAGSIGENPERTWSVVGRRSIGRTESADFQNLPLSETILTPGPEMAPSDHLYTNCRTTVPGAPDHHLMFPAIWHTSSDTTSICLAASHDGKLWHFLPGSPVFSTGPFGTWDGGCVFAHPNLLELSDGRFVLPYTGYNVPHKYPRGQWTFVPGYMVWPKGRLVSLDSADIGAFATVGIIPPGRKVRLNARTKRAGHILVEVADLRGNPLPGRSFSDASPVIGDNHAIPLTWKGEDDLGHKEGEGIILRFQLEEASIFGLIFE